MKIIYPQEWDKKKELGFIANIGMERVLDEHGKFIELRQIKPSSYIREYLAGYLVGARWKDWQRCGISDGDECVEAARTRLKELGGKA
jgi:hypothetical protein